MNETERLKNKVLQLNSEVAQEKKLRNIESNQHKKDIRILMDRLTHQDEEETYLTCKDHEIIDDLQDKLIKTTEKIRRIRCVYLAIGIICGIILKAVI